MFAADGDQDKDVESGLTGGFIPILFLNKVVAIKFQGPSGLWGFQNPHRMMVLCISVLWFMLFKLKVELKV